MWIISHVICWNLTFLLILNRVIGLIASKRARDEAQYVVCKWVLSISKKSLIFKHKIHKLLYCKLWLTWSVCDLYTLLWNVRFLTWICKVCVKAQALSGEISFLWSLLTQRSLLGKVIKKGWPVWFQYASWILKQSGIGLYWPLELFCLE